jgi:hypothetical protein
MGSDNMKYKVGQKVEFVGHYINDYTDREPVGLRGIIVYIKNYGDNQPYGVKFTEYSYHRHDLDKRCKNGHGWWCAEDNLKLISYNESDYE